MMPNDSVEYLRVQCVSTGSETVAPVTKMNFKNVRRVNLSAITALSRYDAAFAAPPPNGVAHPRPRWPRLL